MWSKPGKEALTRRVHLCTHTPRTSDPWPAFATSHSNAVVGTPVIISVVHAIIRHYRRLVRPHVVRMPVKDVFPCIQSVIRFFDTHWCGVGRKRAQPSSTKTHLVLIGSNYHFTLILMHADGHGGFKVTHFDPMLAEKNADTPTELVLRDWCASKDRCQFYRTRCHWQQDGIHCGMYACAATQTVCIQLVQQRTLCPRWIPSSIGSYSPLQLKVGVDNAAYVQKSLRLSYALLVTQHARHLKRKLPVDFSEIEPPFRNRRSNRVSSSNAKISPNDVVIDLVSDSD